jgi:protein-tyrosine phosphatase
VSGHREAGGDRRWVDLEGAFNFRDVGGYVTADGARVRWGQVFRSDALHHLWPADVQAVRALGVDRVIDLRSPEEISTVGRGALGDTGIEYVTASVIPMAAGEAVGAPSGDDIAERYLWYLDVGADALVDAFGVLAEADRGAVVFHCAAGKDRTGVVAAMLLAVLGVGEDDIVADYALTNRALPAILARLAADPVHAEGIAQMPANRRVVQPETMRRFLQLLGAEHGGARAWLDRAGLDPASVDALRARLRD